MLKKPKLLFICTANISRSRAAEDLFKDNNQYEVKSAGIRRYSLSKNTVDQSMIDWADGIFVMDEENDRHFSFLRVNFNILNKNIYILGIRNIFGRKDPELIRLLTIKLAYYGIDL